MSWRCLRVRNRLALCVGDDLAERDRRSVERHLAGCPSCRDHLVRLRRAREAMICSEPVLETISPLWPALRGRLQDVQIGRRPERPWLPIGALAAASIAIAAVLWTQPYRSDARVANLSHPRDLTASHDSLPDSLPAFSQPRSPEWLVGDRRRLPPGTSYFHLERAQPPRGRGDF
jgi:hypothetical protein